MSKKCEDCGVEIDEKYIVCSGCAKKRKEEKGDRVIQDKDALLEILGKINSNLYAIRTQGDIVLKRTFGVSIETDPETKRFKEVKEKKVKK